MVECGVCYVSRFPFPSLALSLTATSSPSRASNHQPGFRELAKADARFEPYARTLFARPSPSNDPDALEGPQARALDAALAAFARLVGPRLPEPAAARALEFLVRRFGATPSLGPN